LALIIAVFYLAGAAIISIFPTEASDLFRNYLTEQIQQFMGLIAILNPL
jgi:hypothetical protein